MNNMVQLAAFDSRPPTRMISRTRWIPCSGASTTGITGFQGLALKLLIRNLKRSGDSLGKMDAALHRLKGRFRITMGWSTPTTSRNAGRSTTEEAVWAQVRLVRVMSGTGRSCSYWFTNELQWSLSALLSPWVNWFRTQTQHLSRSALDCFAAVNRQVVSVPITASPKAALWVSFFSTIFLILVWVSSC
ncbi:hypothetical protein N657DRAFT_165618 [Parathielavia appendiculata]|uniref:Uncharacterized protein n=1 Tax=Parathielavia appendiculata TaxID=2587402 RepID=A0AAN6YZS4_9PEZI|nr:hypothetical protein N657DRAFT_165618 [Parathielavia appendiculata]